jgi:putative aldouronate transport system permease protein
VSQHINYHNKQGGTWVVQVATASTVTTDRKFKQKPLHVRVWKARWLYLLLLPGLLFYIIFKYIPLMGSIMAFQDYKPHLGVMGSKWVGMKHFDRFFSEPQFWMLMRNTFILAFYNIIFYFPIPIVLALLLNEVRNEKYKRFVQTLTYMPHFLSWVVIVGITYLFLSTDGGLLNDVLQSVGLSKVNFMMSEGWFRPLIVLQNIWREAGWGSIIFLAALAGVHMELYEAAKIEGANRFQQLWHITLPAIRSTIITLLILRLGHFLDLGFEHIFLMLNAMNREVGEVFDTYVYTYGVLQGQFSYSTAVGLFKSLIALVLVVATNYITKKLGEEGIY